MYFESLPYFAVRLLGTVGLMFLTLFYSSRAIRGSQTKKLMALSMTLTIVDVISYYLIRDERWFIIANVLIVVGFIIQGIVIKLNGVYVIFQWVTYILISVIGGALLNIFFFLLGYQENQITSLPVILISYLFVLGFGYGLLRGMKPVFVWVYTTLTRRLRLLITIGGINAVSMGMLLYYIISVNVFRKKAATQLVMGDTIAILTAVIVEAVVLGVSYLVIVKMNEK